MDRFARMSRILSATGFVAVGCDIPLMSLEIADGSPTRSWTTWSPSCHGPCAR
ncbi:hypothetical protein [Actinoplanes sp. OR16]|uniref:hypothetical protein n=1 Tax=Actinoplanes sp. OR16 TaxID=946334 RepID=UPI00135F1B82|nr:hypothetical protein [Actinoplanes sp. OR16]